MKKLIFAALMATVCAAPLHAQGLQITNEALVQVVTVDADGNEVINYEPAAQVVPGDVIRYVLNLSNESDEAVSGISLTSQIPSDLLIQESTADTPIASVQYSIDGGASFANRSVLVVTAEDGTQRPAEAGDLTNVMWTVHAEIPAGESQTLSYLATVE